MPGSSICPRLGWGPPRSLPLGLQVHLCRVEAGKIHEGRRPSARHLPAQPGPPTSQAVRGARVDAQGSPLPGPSLHSPPLIAFQLYV